MKRRIIFVGLAAAVLLAILSPLASASPDGLERVADDHGFLQRAQEPAYQALPDYTIPGIANESASTIIAGVVGALLVFGAAYGIGAAVKRRHTTGAH